MMIFRNVDSRDVFEITKRHRVRIMTSGNARCKKDVREAPVVCCHNHNVRFARL